MRAALAALIICAVGTAAHADVASCYGREHGQTRVATGAAYDPWRLSAAHRTLPFGTRLLVTNQRNGRAVVVTINDRGPAAWTHRAIDLSLGACRAIGNRGLASVFLQIVGGPHEAHFRDRSRRSVRGRRRR